MDNRIWKIIIAIASLHVLVLATMLLIQHGCDGREPTLKAERVSPSSRQSETPNEQSMATELQLKKLEEQSRRFDKLLDELEEKFDKMEEQAKRYDDILAKRSIEPPAPPP